MAIAARCRMPPENSWGYRSWREPEMPTNSSNSAVRSRAALPSASLAFTIGSWICEPIVLTGSKAFIAPWKTIEMSFHRCGRIVASPPARMSSPLRIILPAALAVGGKSPIIARIAVVLPQPDSPTRPSRSPGSSSKLMPWTACNSLWFGSSNQTWRSSIARTGVTSVAPCRAVGAGGNGGAPDGSRVGVG